MAATLLVIDDDPALLMSLKQILQADYTIVTAATAKDGLHKLSQGDYDCVILDYSLPDLSGLEVCRHLRHAGNVVPVILVSGNDEPALIAELLDAGADDYIVKPARPAELLARVRGVLRRTRLPQAVAARIEIGDVLLDGAKHRVTRGGQAIKLRPKEFALLECLMQNPGRVISRPILLRYGWDENSDVWTNVVDVHIKYLRDKFDQPFSRHLIKTVHGIGYKFDNSVIANPKKGGRNNERLIAGRPD